MSCFITLAQRDKGFWPVLAVDIAILELPSVESVQTL
jgi:hypothetical protein